MKEIRESVTVLVPHREDFESENARYVVLEHKKCKNKFTFPAGTCEKLDKYPVYTAMREMAEELDIEIKLHDLNDIAERYAYYDRIDGHRIYKETTFICRGYHGEVRNMEPDKHPSMKWVTLEEIFDNPECFTYNTWLVASELLHNKV